MKIGDQIKYLNEPGGGVISEINGNLLLVLDHNGFEDWVEITQVILDIKTDYRAVSYHDVSKKEGSGKIKSVKHSKRHLEKLEVDLHLHTFMQSTRGFTNHEKVLAQMGEARKAFASATAGKYKYLRLIHGKGSGKLRNELWQWLRHKNVVDFYDIDISGEKSGVTEVQMY